MLDTVGYVAQVIVNQRTGHLVDGHLRVEEALSHGQPTIPVVYVDLSEDEERLVLASVDPLAAMATTDEAKLRELLAEVSVDSEALAAMLAALAPAEPKDGLVDPDDVPEPPDEPITKPDDLWLLGDHRLLCGDAGSEADLDRLLDGETVDLLLTDPPYNVRVEPRSNNAIAAGMAASYDESYQEALASSSRKRGTAALDAQGLHHSGFDVARGKSGIRHHQKLDVERHPEKAQATHRKLRAKDRPLVNDFISDDAFEALLLAWFSNAARVLRPGGSFYVTVPASARAAAPASWVSSRPRTAARPMSRPLTLFETCPARRASQTTSALPSSRTYLSGCAWRSPEPMWRRRQSTARRLPGRRSPRYPVPRASAPRRGRAHAPRASRSSRPRPRRRHHRR